MAPADAPAQIAVVVAYSPAPRRIDQVSLRMPAQSTLGDALRASGLLDRHPEIDVATSKLGVWGKLRGLGDTLREGDRVEVYRPLKVDPKEARRQRYRSHREKSRAAG
ncbi:MAG TPA: RnfH family protein [Albitalea sp.]|nr:RnfH family protein [Albitalea sp.]